MTREEFINREVAIWGEDYIFDLLDRGYEPKLTSEGWRWFAPVITRITRNAVTIA